MSTEILAPPVLVRLTAEELADLRYAKTLLENPHLAMRLANLVGSPLEAGFKMLPKGWSAKVHSATQAALMKALQLALLSLGKRARRRSSDGFHRLLVGASGAVGGAVGLAALPVELPVSTAIMLRSIADIARSEGHLLSQLPVRLACLEVFALGGPGAKDDAAETGYWAVRAGLAKAMAEAAGYLARRGVVDSSAPALVRLVSSIGARFGVVVSEEVAAKAIPLVGAASGTLVNILFINHFQDMARGHFIVRRLEARHGLEAVREAYARMAMAC
jgi:hypothetical protein